LAIMRRCSRGTARYRRSGWETRRIPPLRPRAATWSAALLIGGSRLDVL